MEKTVVYIYRDMGPEVAEAFRRNKKAIYLAGMMAGAAFGYAHSVHRTIRELGEKAARLEKRLDVERTV